MNDVPTEGVHCGHWCEGDGDCCWCREPNWCPDSGEDATALRRYEERQACPAVGGHREKSSG